MNRTAQIGTHWDPGCTKYGQHSQNAITAVVFLRKTKGQEKETATLMTIHALCILCLRWPQVRVSVGRAEATDLGTVSSVHPSSLAVSLVPRVSPSSQLLGRASLQIFGRGQESMLAP